jgi:hypothetical protein
VPPDELLDAIAELVVAAGSAAGPGGVADAGDDRRTTPDRQGLRLED